MTTFHVSTGPQIHRKRHHISAITAVYLMGCVKIDTMAFPSEAVVRHHHVPLRDSQGSCPEQMSQLSNRRLGTRHMIPVARRNGNFDTTEKEDILAKRAYVEQSLLTKNQDILTMASEEERLEAALYAYYSHLGYSPSVDKSRFGAVVLREGVARINNCLSPSTASRLLSFVNEELMDSTLEVMSGAVSEKDRFGDVLSRNNRWDLFLPLEESDAVIPAFRELLYEGSPLATAIQSILGEDAVLHELSCIVSDPGSTRQVIHPDVVFQGTEPRSLTCFVALQDVTVDMGPTTFVPRSATRGHHEQTSDIRSLFRMLDSSPSRLSTLRVGDCSLYNPTTLHCGGANRSTQRRCLFYFSFLDPHRKPRTSDISMRPELARRNLTLRQLRGLVGQPYAAKPAEASPSLV